LYSVETINHPVLYQFVFPSSKPRN